MEKTSWVWDGRRVGEDGGQVHPDETQMVVEGRGAWVGGRRVEVVEIRAYGGGRQLGGVGRRGEGAGPRASGGWQRMRVGWDGGQAGARMWTAGRWEWKKANGERTAGEWGKASGGERQAIGIEKRLGVDGRGLRTGSGEWG